MIQLEKSTKGLQRCGGRHRKFWMLRTKAIASQKGGTNKEELERFSVVSSSCFLWCESFNQILERRLKLFGNMSFLLKTCKEYQYIIYIYISILIYQYHIQEECNHFDVSVHMICGRMEDFHLNDQRYFQPTWWDFSEARIRNMP